MALVQLTKWADVHHLPLLALNQRPLNQKERYYQNALLDGQYRVLVVVSITAAQMGLASLSDDERRALVALNQSGRLAVVAVGTATKRQLEQAGLVVETPAVPSNEAMATMPVINDLTHQDKVLFWRGVGGRQQLFNALLSKGVIAHSVAWYQRTLPANLLDDGHQLLTRLQSPIDTPLTPTNNAPLTSPLHVPLTPNLCYDSSPVLPMLVLISSKTAWEHWQYLITTLNFADNVPFDWDKVGYLTLGERLTKLVAQHNNAECIWGLSDDQFTQALKRLGAKRH